MHGTADDTVPPKHSQRLYEAAKEPKELWLAPDAWHCALMDKYPAEFKARIRKFFAQHFPAAVAPTRVPTPPTGAAGASAAAAAGAQMQP